MLTNALRIFVKKTDSNMFTLNFNTFLTFKKLN